MNIVSDTNFDYEAPHRPPRWLLAAVATAAVIVLSVWAIGTPPGILGKADAVAYAICHRIESHSFLMNGVPMPLCARCTGIYLGVMTSFLIAVAAGRARVSRLPPLRVGGFLGLFVVTMGIDGVNSYIHLFPAGTGLYEPQNWLRLVTGVYCGISMFHIIFPIFNGAVWQNPDNAHGLNDLRELLGVCAVAAGVILLVLSERPVFLWVFGAVSAFGVVMMLTMIGAVFFLSVTGYDRTATRWRDLALPLLAGITIAFILIGGVDIVRFALTHTWDGFALAG
jgi:uncharacterized membrane protein